MFVVDFEQMTLSRRVLEYTNIFGMKEHAGLLQKLRWLRQLTPSEAPEWRKVDYGIAYGPSLPDTCNDVTVPLQWQVAIPDDRRLYWISLDEYTEKLNNAFMSQDVDLVIEL